MKKNCIPLIALVLTTSLAFAGPFGLSKGMKKEEFPEGLTELSNQSFFTLTVPTPSPLIKSYVLTFGKNQGLAKIFCNTPTVRTSVYGEGVISEFQKVESALIKRYGEPKKFDLLHGGSIWTEERYWTTSLQKKERTLASTWSTKSGNKLPDNLQAILVKAVAIDSEKIAITVTYEFDNFAEVAAEIEAKNAEGL